MLNRISQFIDKYHLHNKRVIVGFSGGYDSMCLLDILVKIRDKYKLDIIAAHYNHNWRGEKARQEQSACENYCLQKGVDFYTETSPDSIKKTETEARELRYNFFERVFNKYNADVIFTAHNFNDNAETILYRIIKGTGIVGLRGIMPNRGIYYRPLLEIKRSEIEKYCSENGLTPNVDDSNNDNIHNRNLIRNEVLPILNRINPETLTALNNLGQLANIELGIVDEYIDNINKELLSCGKIRTEIFRNLSENVKQKIIYNLIFESDIDYTKESIENILKFINNTLNENKPSKCSLDGNNWLYVDKNIIEIISAVEKNNDIIPITNLGEYKFNGYKFKIEEADSFKKLPDETGAYIDLTNVDRQNMVIRTRKEGDIIQPLGSAGHMKLKKYLMAKNIPQHERDNLLLVADKNEVLWVAGVGLSDKIKTVSVPTHYMEIRQADYENY